MIERGIRRIWDNDAGPPTSDRIVHDVLQVIEALYIVYKAKGNIVPGLCDRNGQRNTEGQRGQWGGKRVKSLTIDKDTWLESHAATVLNNQKQFIVSKYLKACEEIESNEVRGRTK